jgi:hypothetical protein
MNTENENLNIVSGQTQVPNGTLSPSELISKRIAELGD